LIAQLIIRERKNMEILKYKTWHIGITKEFSWKLHLTNSDIYELDPEYNLFTFHWLWFWGTKIF